MAFLDGLQGGQRDCPEQEDSSADETRYGSKHRPVALRFGGASGRHGLLLGASGSGKTNALLWCLSRHIDAGFGVVVVDMKGDQLLARRLQRIAEVAEVAEMPYYEWSLDGFDQWNPLARGSRSELKDKF